MLYHLSPLSSNAKTGPIAVSTTSSDSCPPSCPLIDSGCYAKGGPLAMHWRATGEAKGSKKGARGLTLEQFTSAIRYYLNPGQLFRLNQAGDLPGVGENVDVFALDVIRYAIIEKGAHAFTYTHKKSVQAKVAVKRNNSANVPTQTGKLVINVSADTMQEAVELYREGFPATVVVPEDFESQKVNGVNVAVCPAQLSDTVTCATCKACAIQDRQSIIAFRVHGAMKGRASKAIVKLSELTQGGTL